MAPIVALYTTLLTLVDRTTERVGARRDAGQGAIEYLGMLIVVAAAIVVISQTNFGSSIATGITSAVSKVTSLG